MSWEKPQFNGLQERLNRMSELLNQLAEAHAQELNERLKRMKLVAEKAQALKQRKLGQK